jgi:hypothetical protein
MKVNISTNSIEKLNILQLKKIISFINTITYLLDTISKLGCKFVKLVCLQSYLKNKIYV